MSTTMQTEARRYATAKAHADAHPRRKRAAALLGVTPRQERRYRDPKTAHMGPLGTLLDYVVNAEESFRVIARILADAVKAKKVNRMSRDEVIARIRELHVKNAVQEGVDNGNRARRGMEWHDRAVDCERDAAHDLELSALYLRCAELEIGEEEVFGA